MNLLADESVDRPIVDRLRQDGHSVRYIAESDPGIHDDAVLDQANRSGDVLITADKDFSELVFRMGRIHTGVILIRLAGLSAEMKAGTVSDVLANRGRELASGFSVISPGSVRVRRQDRGD